MSRRDVETVATLAAHLAARSPKEWADNPASWGRYADDAMALQKLGRRARRHFAKLDAKNGIYWRAADEHELIPQLGDQILAPYGLTCEVQDLPFDERALIIVGLPCNGLNQGRHELGTVNGVNTFRDGFAI